MRGLPRRNEMASVEASARRGSARGKKPPVKLIAAGAAGFLLLLLGVWVIFRDKDGNEVARVAVPEGGTATVQTAGPGSAVGVPPSGGIKNPAISGPAKAGTPTPPQIPVADAHGSPNSSRSAMKTRFPLCVVALFLLLSSQGQAQGKKRGPRRTCSPSSMARMSAMSSICGRPSRRSRCRWSSSSTAADFEPAIRNR